jgi:PD-(D/E)XK endonuclease
MESAWTPRRQGDAGELSALTWLSQAGAFVAKPLFEASDYDLLADWGDHIDRVQVKTSTCWRNARFVVALCTRGGNRSWNGIVKRLNATRCDRVFVHVGDGRRWYIPANALGGGSAIVLGGPKYAEYEVEPGEPLQARPPPPEPPAVATEVEARR